MTAALVAAALLLGVVIGSRRTRRAVRTTEGRRRHRIPDRGRAAREHAAFCGHPTRPHTVTIPTRPGPARGPRTVPRERIQA